MRHIDIDTGFKHRYLKLWRVAQRQDRASSTRQYAPVPAGGRGEKGKKGRRKSAITGNKLTFMQFAQRACRQLLKHISRLTLHIFCCFSNNSSRGEGRGGEGSNGEAKPIQGTNELISRQQAVGAGTESE